MPAIGRQPRRLIAAGKIGSSINCWTADLHDPDVVVARLIGLIRQDLPVGRPRRQQLDPDRRRQLPRVGQLWRTGGGSRAGPQHVRDRGQRDDPDGHERRHHRSTTRRRRRQHRRRSSHRSGRARGCHESQLGEQIRRRLMPVIRALSERSTDEPIELGRDVGPDGRERRWRAFRNDRSGRAGVVARGREPPGHHLVQHDTEGPDVTSRVGGRADTLLGRHVGGRADGDTDAGQLRPRLLLRTNELGDTEVQNLHEPIAGDEQVGRLDVAVHDAGGMSLRKASGDLLRVVDRLGQGDGTAGDLGLDRLALVIRHRDEEPPVRRLVDLVDRADVGMVQRRGRLRLDLEAALGVLVLRAFSRKELQRDRSLELGVLGKVDHAHSAAAERVDDAIVRDGLADHSKFQSSKVPTFQGSKFQGSRFTKTTSGR